jgi:hypothetical protein
MSISRGINNEFIEQFENDSNISSTFNFQATCPRIYIRDLFSLCKWYLRPIFNYRIFIAIYTSIAKMLRKRFISSNSDKLNYAYNNIQSIGRFSLFEL